MPRRALAIPSLLIAGFCCVVTVVWAFTADGGGGRTDVDILDRLSAEEPADEHMLWLLAAIDGEEITEEEIESRFSDPMNEAVPAEELVELIDQAKPNNYQFEGVLERSERQLVIQLGSQTNGPFFPESLFVDLLINPAEPYKIEGLFFLPHDPQPRPHSTIQITVVALASATILGAAWLVMVTNRFELTILFAVAALFWSAQLVADSGSSSWEALSAVLPWLGIGLAALGVIDIAGVRPLTVQSYGASLPSLIIASCLMSIWLTQVETAEIGLSNNLFAVRTNADVAVRLLDFRAVLGGTLAFVFGCLALWRYRLRPSGMRVTARPVLGSALAVSLGASGVAGLWLIDGGRASLTLPVFLSLGLVVLVGGVLGSTLMEYLRLGEVVQLVVDIGDGAQTSSIEESLRDALADPELQLLLWSDEQAEFLDVEGSPCQPTADHRVMTRLEADGQLLGAVVHHRDQKPEQVRAACSAVRLAIENLRLHAEVRSQLANVHASRVRLVTAADDARRQLERNLHDGAQQGILAGLVEIQRARWSIERPEVVIVALKEASSHFETALREVREIAQGLRPGALDRGLLPAIREIADRCTVPVEVSGSRSRVSAHLEQAVYYVVSEALTNISRHAKATQASVTVAVEDKLVVTVVDDGNGRAELRAGGGLRGVFDRVEALGGQVTFNAVLTQGTTIMIELPLTEPQDSVEGSE